MHTMYIYTIRMQLGKGPRFFEVELLEYPCASMMPG